MMVIEGDKPLPLQLFTQDDDDDAIAIKSRLEAVINGSVTPTQAAAGFDAWLVHEAEQRLEAFQKRTGQDRYDLTAEEERGFHSLRSIGPDPEGHINHLFEGIARLCSSFPPFHAAQGLIMEFLEALRALPQHDVPTVTPIWRLYDGNTGELSVPDHPGWDMIRLWPFTDPDCVLSNLVKNQLRQESERKYPPSRNLVSSLRAAHLASMENVFLVWDQQLTATWVFTDTYSYEFSDVETLGSELRVRWRNFQSFAARLTVAGLADCRYICALRDILPSSRQYPDLNSRKVGGLNRISADAVAGAQWVMWPDEGRWVYEECKKAGDGGADDDPWGIWNLQGWKGWKSQLAWIERDERFDPRSQVVAKLARQQMEGYEAEDEAEETARKKAENRTRLP